MLFQNMSVKIYTIFLSSGGYNFKINYLKGKLRHGMSLYLAKQFGIIPIATRILLLAQEVKML